MKSFKNPVVFITLGISSQLSFASGQHTTILNYDTIKNYQNLSLREGRIAEKYLNYIGTVNNEVHIFMITKTSYSKSSSGRIGMPWSHVFKYKIPVEEMTIVNGWDITYKVKHGINVRPSYCPRVYLSAKQKEYIIANNKRVKSKCIPILRFSR